MTTLSDTVIRSLTSRQIANFCAKVEYAGEDECWTWKGWVHPNGYGTWTVHRAGRYTSLRPHRVAWFLRHEDIDAGLTIDHLCRNRLCVNPEHLELVGIGENTARALPHRVLRESRGATVRERVGPRGTSYAVLFRADGKQRSRTFSRLAEAEAFAADIRLNGVGRASTPA